MSQSEQRKQQQKVVQYLNEAHASEHALVRVLQSQIAMTPRGAYRSGAGDAPAARRATTPSASARRLKDARPGLEPADGRRRRAGDRSRDRSLALGKTPFDLVRGSGGEEKVLKNAKDAYATEALEIATYTALERLARSVGDTQTADARRVDPRRRGEDARSAILREIPKLTDAVVGADVKGKPSYDVTDDRRRRRRPRRRRGDQDQARKTTAAAKRTARQARKVPGVAQVEGQVKGAVAAESDLAIARYDSLTADEITSRLPELSQIDLAKVDSYERRNQNRTTVLNRISTLRGNEPWAGYDELTVSRGPGRALRGRRRARQAGPHLRARAQEPRRRPAAAERELSNA